MKSIEKSELNLVQAGTGIKWIVTAPAIPANILSETIKYILEAPILKDYSKSTGAITEGFFYSVFHGTQSINK